MISNKNEGLLFVLIGLFGQMTCRYWISSLGLLPGAEKTNERYSCSQNVENIKKEKDLRIMGP